MLWPLGAPASAPSALIKCSPEDFRVDERLGFEPTGDGEHLLVRIEKRNLNTRTAARCLARAAGVPERDVGYAGMKDRRAVTTQWMSLRGAEPDVLRAGACLPTEGPSPDGPSPDGPSLRLLGVHRHARKLRRGDHAGNAFAIVLRGVDPQSAREGLDRLGGDGAPNYFGPQRFGRGGASDDNLARARRWIEGGSRRHSRFERGLHLSVLRSFLFNEVLAARVADGSWRSAVSGDVLVDGLPTGPLWGRGRSGTEGVAAEIEAAALAPHAAIRDALEHAGLRQDRRALVLSPRHFDWRIDDLPAAGRAHGDADTCAVRVAFELAPGGYATSLLGAAFALQEPERCGGVG